MKISSLKNYKRTAKHKTRTHLLYLCISVIIFLGGCDEHGQQKSAQNQKPTLNILFIGNSYTYYNNMPVMLQAMINSNPQSEVNANIHSVVQGGQILQGHWNDGKALQAIKNGTQWHYVVLQAQSNWAALPGNIQSTFTYAQNFANEITAINAVPVTYITWPKQPNSQAYRDMPFLRDFSHSYHAINRQSKTLTKKIGSQPVPVNDYWVTTMQKAPSIQLYDPDGSHPSLAGSYLAALIFHKILTGTPYQNKNLPLPGLDPDAQKALESVAVGHVEGIAEIDHINIGERIAYIASQPSDVKI